MSSVAKRSRDISIFANHRRFFRSGACPERSRMGREVSGLADEMETARLRSGWPPRQAGWLQIYL